MTLRIHAVTVLCGLSLAATGSAAETNQDAMQRIADEDKVLRMKEVLRKRDVDILFVGKILDQNNAPVEGANVEIHILHFVPDASKLFGGSKSIIAATDKTGTFSIEDERGGSVYVQGVSKPGYEYIRSQNTNNSFEYFAHGNQKPFVADRASPVIFRLRKQGDTTFCLKTQYWDCQISTNEPGKAKGYDFIRQESVRDLANPTTNGEPLTSDFQMKATFNTNHSVWAVVLSPGNTNGGIIVSEQLFYEAPESGYQPEHTFTTETRKQTKGKYIYLRSREPVIYTCLKVDVVASERFCRLQGKCVTNPYGDRNLELVTDLPYEVTKQLTDEVKAAFRQGKRPERPDLPKLIKEAKEKVEKDKS